MAKTLIGALALASLPSALAFSNTSPFFLFSTADLLIPSADASIADSSAITADVLGALKHCPTRNYVIVEQKGVSSTDYVDARLAPRLAHYMTAQDGVRSTFAVPEVIGQIDTDALRTYLKDNCAPTNSDQAWYALLKAPAPGTSKAQREADLKSQDDALDEFVADKMGGQDYTVIYTTAPQTESQAKAQIEEEQQQTYEMEPPYGQNVQMELKRDTSAHVQRANSTSSEGGLFERYQYFTPGLFMGFIAVIPLFLILLVGVRALTSLEVSYFAFSKEMGPNAQKKQQQQ